MSTLLDWCKQFPKLLDYPPETIYRFLSLLHHFKECLVFTQHSSSSGAPQCLTAAIHGFLKDALDLDDYQVQYLWGSLKGLVFEQTGSFWTSPDLKGLLPLFFQYGPRWNVGVLELLPPTRTCLSASCCREGKAAELGERFVHEATLFTLAHGPLPIYTASYYCHGCLTRYHHNCYVRGNKRTYYSPDNLVSPEFLQITTHFFMEHDLCERFANQMAMGCVSAQNCAKLYNVEAREKTWACALPIGWPATYALDYELVGEAFITHVLVKWHAEHGTVLQVPHKDRTRAGRWHEAVQARNLAIAGTGQPEWNHACDKCTKYVVDEHGNITGAIRSVVTDGVSLGHPCCGVHNCKEPLPNNRHRYCATHASKADECAVDNCGAPAEQPFLTCANPEHRDFEKHYKERSSAMFQLKRCLAKAHGYDPDCQDAPESMGGSVGTAPSPDDEDVVIDQTGEEVDEDQDGNVHEGCAKKPVEGLRKKVFARFGRRRTHNEQLCVASCGIILGRATFYGSEGPNSVRIFWKCLFPTQASLPSVMWYDNNCHMAAMLAADSDHYFDNVALPVDVFHFKCKHKERDTFCGRHCNPYRWHELVDEETGEWVFNSSAAEQVNSWFGGFKAITRLMRADRFNFFLDEMILRRNAVLREDLKKDGFAPISIPREDLLK